MSPRIMIVEDERIVALDLKGGLENLGYEVVGIAARGTDAIHGADTLRPDLILMDIHLEGEMDGTEAGKHIYDHFNLPVVYLTAFAEEQTLARAEASVPYGYLLKPFELRELEATVRMALARRRAEVKVEEAEQRLRLAMEAADLGVWEWQTQSDAFTSGGHLENILGSTPRCFRDGRDAFIGRVHPEDRQAVADAIDSGEHVSMTVRMSLANGGAGWVELYAKNYPGENGGPARVVGVIRDVTERRHNEEKLRQASVVFETTAEALVILDIERRIISVNPAFSALTGYLEEEVIGRDPDEFLHARRHSDQFYPHLDESEDGYWQGEIACVRRSGEIFPAWQHVCAVRDEERTISQYVIAFSDISAIREAEAQISHLAFHDALTGLGNRHLLEERLETEINRAKRNDQRLALIFIDLDGFKLINDTLGHAAGDQLLQAVSRRIHSALRRSDVAIRLGGDEFVIIVPEIGRVEDAAVLAEKLLNEIRMPVDVAHESVTVSASIGIALFPDNASDRHDLVKAADSAMYGAKGRGRNRYAFYSPDMAERARERMSIEQALRRALEEKQLLLHYQPVVGLADGTLTGLEALARWQHPQYGLVAPDRFIPVAEESGLIEYVGEWVMEEACRRGAEWLNLHQRDFRLAVNVSVREMSNENFVDRVAAILERTGFPARLLELEITESTLQSIEHSQGLLYRLKALGVAIAIDDFGTGFSSLGLLKHLPIDRIKIDRSFIRDLPNDANDAAITRAIAAMAKTMGLSITAEGIETSYQRDFLRELGCEDAQGFLFSTPLAANKVEELLHANKPPASLN